jgi:hypothetical protein
MKIRLCGSYVPHPLRSALGDYESREEEDRRADEMSVSRIALRYVCMLDSAEASVAHGRFIEAGSEMPQLVRRVGRYVARP